MTSQFFRREGVLSILIAAFFCAAVLYLVWVSDSRKVFGQGNSSVAIGLPVQAYDVWERNRVRGRVLFLFDRQLNADPDEYSGMPDARLKVKDDNYVYVAFRKNIVRAVYHIIPDASWHEVERNLDGNPYVQRLHQHYRIGIEGMQVMIMRLQDIPVTKEPVLIAINTKTWGQAGVVAVGDLQKRGVLSSDIVTIADDASADEANQTGEHEHGRP